MTKKYNAIVGQSGGPTSAINATLSGIVKGAKSSGKIGTLYGMRYGIEGLLEENIFSLTDRIKTEKDRLLLKKTPGAGLGSCRRKLKPFEEDKETYEKILNVLKKYEIRYFFYIGGNDSMDTVMKLSKYAKTVSYPLTVFGVPKTIDNDLAGTDHTPGFGSAAKYIASTVREVLLDTAVYTVKAVTVIEIMGRDAGWLTASSGLCSLVGDAPDLIYLPERPFDKNEFISDVKKALERRPNVVVCVSEGVKDKDGKYVCESYSDKKDVFGHQALSGAGKALESFVKEEIGCKVRSIELNTPQRCAGHLASKRDLDESEKIGEFAVERALAGETGVMATFQRESDEKYKVRFETEEIGKIANAVRHVPDEYINERGNGITKACLDYLAPLIEGEEKTEYEFGLPKYIKL